MKILKLSPLLNWLLGRSETIYNHLLSDIHPEHACIVYYTKVSKAESMHSDLAKDIHVHVVYCGFKLSQCQCLSTGEGSSESGGSSAGRLRICF